MKIIEQWGRGSGGVVHVGPLSVGIQFTVVLSSTLTLSINFIMEELVGLRVKYVMGAHFGPIGGPWAIWSEPSSMASLLRFRCSKLCQYHISPLPYPFLIIYFRTFQFSLIPLYLNIYLYIYTLCIYNQLQLHTCHNLFYFKRTKLNLVKLFYQSL